MYQIIEQNEPDNRQPPEPRLLYTWAHRPAGTCTRGEWLREGFEPKPSAVPIAKIQALLDKPHSDKLSFHDPLSPEEIGRLREALLLGDRGVIPPEIEDAWERARRANHIARPCALYSKADVQPILQPTQQQAWELLADLWRRGSSDQFILGYQTDAFGELKTKTVTLGVKNFDRFRISEHRNGRNHHGVKRGRKTNWVDFDLDRHKGAVPAAEQREKLGALLAHLRENFADWKVCVSNLNPKNGSLHVVVFLPAAWTIDEAKAWITEVRSALPSLQHTEVYPDTNCPQVYCPLRLDKVSICDQVVPKLESRRYNREGRRRKAERYMAYDAVWFWNWLTDDEPRHPDPRIVVRELDQAMAQCPDAPKAPKRRRAQGPSRVTSGPGPRLRLRGCCARTLADFWGGTVTPEDDTVTKYTTVSLRALRHTEEMDQDDAVDWIESHLHRLPDQSFSDRLANDPEELMRTIRKSADVIWTDNGYQQDPDASAAIWLKVRAAWLKRGFRLSDESTWDSAGQDAAEVRQLRWDAISELLLPGLSEVAGCSLDQARGLAERIASHIEGRNEMALSYLARIMKELGLTAYQDKVVRVRRLLVDVGFLVRVKRGFRDKETGYSHGDFYVLGPMVEFLPAEAAPHLVLSPEENQANKGVSNYPSLVGLDGSWLRQLARRSVCLRRYGDRLRRLYGLLRQAA